MLHAEKQRAVGQFAPGKLADPLVARFANGKVEHVLLRAEINAVSHEQNQQRGGE